jgi:LAO/AO transport system kinase
MITAYRARGDRVGVIAVDPSSPTSGGALLADRVRMQGHALDAGVFVRSLASRGSLGGISRSTAATLAILEGLGFERAIIETVGVGQAEVDVSRLADTNIVVLAPGLGDEVQALKAGLMEVADLFAVNKADREGADRTVRDVEATLRLRPESEVEGGYAEVLAVSALERRGIDELLAAVERHRAKLIQSGRLAERRRIRARLEIETALRAEIERELLARVGGAPVLEASAVRVADRSTDALSEVARLLASR